ncbi:MAG: hypothetical protein KKE62_03440 [Proteobacteria bacterium]|nr:hypothetical protein [Bacteroidota bacterium]MBU1541877.1 hypothetical protein [Pseudomonadota bacterium]
MNHIKKTYIVLSIIGSLAIVSSWVVPTTEILKGIIATPVIGALIAALYQLLRDQAAFEKQKYFDIRKRVFEIGATSHMANTAFDKHVEFCEEYMKEVHDTLSTLFREGPSKEAFNHANNSYRLRQKHAAWLTDEINSNLEPYEQVVREIGAWSGFVETSRNTPEYAEHRSQKIGEIYKKFNDVLGLEGGVKIDETYAIESVKKKIREILGIEELTKIRKYLIKEAVAALEKST